MEQNIVSQNRMATEKIGNLIWKMGIPMIISMVLQALYNVVDTAFVINMGSNGGNANLALGYSFPIQILMIAIGVGTGIGINSLLSRYLGQKKNDKASAVCGNGIFLALVIYLVFLIFGIFASKAFISFQANGNTEAIEIGTSYLTIVCTLSLGSVGYTVYERFLQASGKTLFSTIAQISGAVANIVLDYVFIYPLQMGVQGAAYATVIGQFISLFIAMAFHYLTNKEINPSPKFIKPDWLIIKGIYAIGFSAAIMQALLSLMMFSMTMILGLSSEYGSLLQGTFAIYYKIQQIALFAAFGLSNTLITIISFNYGLGNQERVKKTMTYGIIDSMIVALAITVLYEALANPLSELFGLASGGSTEIVASCAVAIRISAIGYVFMAVSVGIQGILQGLRLAWKPLIISLFRLIVLVLPFAYLFVMLPDPVNTVWWSFVIAEVLTSGVSVFFMFQEYRKKIKTMSDLKMETEKKPS
ncbi:MAG: MATE family efflux transporter [Bacilli bacterium]